MASKKSNSRPKWLVLYRIATVVLACCFASALALFFYVDDYSRNYSRTHERQVGIVKIITKYYLKNRAFPDSFATLEKSSFAKKISTTDNWGNPFSIVFPGKSGKLCCVRSAGSDGELSPDDEPGFNGDLIECVSKKDLEELIALAQRSL